jgi:hypothetical protein
MTATLRLLSRIVVGFTLGVLSASSGSLAPRHAHSGAPVTGIPVTLPLSFEANWGQLDNQVNYLARGPGYTVFLTDHEAVLTLKPGVDNRGAFTSEAGRERSRPSSGAAVRIQPVGARRHAAVQALDQLPGISNYFIGSDPAKWRTGIPTYGKVKYEGIYPGVDLVYYGNQRQLEFDFVLAPGADPNTIRLAFQGIDDLELGSHGDLVLKVKDGEVRMHKPFVYQLVEDRRQEVPGDYVLRDRKQVGFVVAAYDTGKPLVIDPILSYSSYLGGNNTEQGKGIAVDSSGNAYVVGTTTSSSAENFPLAGPLGGTPFQAELRGSQDAFVAKVNATGTALVYSSYFGGDNTEEGNGIAVDTSGNAYIVGTTTSSSAENFPLAGPLGGTPFQAELRGSQDAFVAKVNATGTALVYSSYFGGDNTEEGNGIAVDTSGNAYIIGRTTSTAAESFPLTDAFQNDLRGSADTFVAKLNPSGSTPVYSSYLGGTSVETGLGIALDSSGNPYVTGQTGSTDFPTTARAFQPNSTGSSDAFVAKIAPSGSTPPGTSVSDSGGGGGGCFIATASALEPRR